MQACDAQSLVTAANPFQGIPDGLLDAVMIYLLCQWANGQ